VISVPEPALSEAEGWLIIILISRMQTDPPEERRLLELGIMISRDLLEILACPVCRKPLVLRGEDSLKCNECRRVYPIRNGIPILLEPEATIEQL
jgi:hypothetical protein